MLNADTIGKGALAWLGVRPVPLAVGFEITHLCNLECHYCDRHTKLPQEMTKEQIFTALEQFIDLGMKHMSLDGGEPLAHKDIDEVVTFLVGRGVRVFMNTNGILVPRKIETVAKLSRVKISLDGPEERHDRVRGEDAYKKAIAGAKAARARGVSVEFTCVVGAHNADTIDELLDFTDAEGFSIIFQPVRNSLFLDNDREGAFQLPDEAVEKCFERIAVRKRRGGKILNRWSSLRHFQQFPKDVKIPCAAGWINATLDPEGNLYHCGQVSRSDKTNNVVRLGAKAAFMGLHREACQQCWCARVVEENYLWGARVDKLMPPLRVRESQARPAPETKKRLPLL